MVRRVQADWLPAAVCRLLGSRPGDGASVDQFIANAREEGADLSLLWATVDSRADTLGFPTIGQVAMAIASSGQTVVVLVSSGYGPRGGAARAALVERAAVIDAACRHAAGTDPPLARLAQVLLEPDQRELSEAFGLAGFAKLADLAYLRRDLVRGRPAAARFPEGVRTVRLSSLPTAEGRALLCRALERTYEGTLDCPALCGLRNTDDVVASHQSVGEYTPTLWTLLLAGDEPIGCVLLSPTPAHQTVELVYLGLAPSHRGRGLAAELLSHGVGTLAGRPEATLACAVDLANEPALRLYRRAGFRQFATRVALVRGLVRSA